MAGARGKLRFRWTKIALFLLCLAPAAELGYRLYNALHGVEPDLGVNPLEYLTHATGDWTLRLLLLTLLITPARKLLKMPSLIQYRRMIGLFAFFYGTLHFMTYFILDQSLQFGGVWDDVVKRPYLTAGFTAFVLMIPLAITSTQGWIRRLGGKQWNLLHRLIYITAMAAVLLGARLVQRARRMAAAPPRRAVPIRREA